MNIKFNETITECVESVNLLKSSLLGLIASPIKADKAIIGRLEKGLGKEFSNIIEDLDNLEIMVNSLKDIDNSKQDNSQEIISKCIAGVIQGILYGSIASLIFLVFKPEITRSAFCLSFLIGISRSLLKGE